MSAFRVCQLSVCRSFCSTSVALVDPVKLPTCIGGTSQIDFNAAGAIETEPERIRVVIPAGKTHRHELQIDAVGARIRFEFRTKGYNIEFSIHCLEGPPGAEQRSLLGPLRMDSHIAVVADEHVCSQTGTYVLEFDNSFSKFRGKELAYSVSVTSPAAPKKKKRSKFLQDTDG